MLKRFFKPAVATIFSLSGLLFAMPSQAGEYSVEINKTEIMRLPGSAAAVVIGNPKIADISVHSSDTLLINGRGYGETNIIVFDEFGQTVMNADISVSPPRSTSAVRVNYVGAGQETYNCRPYCVPAPVLGDSNEFIGKFEGDSIASTNTTATGPVTINPATINQQLSSSSFEPQR